MGCQNSHSPEGPVPPLGLLGPVSSSLGEETQEPAPCDVVAPCHLSPRARAAPASWPGSTTTVPRLSVLSPASLRHSGRPRNQGCLGLVCAHGFWFAAVECTAKCIISLQLWKQLALLQDPSGFTRMSNACRVGLCRIWRYAVYAARVHGIQAWGRCLGCFA